MSQNALFEDVFRRADKNDDGKIDVPEFKLFFGDDRATDQQLEQYFGHCDEDKNGNIDHSELISFFSSGIGSNYSDIFVSLQNLHSQINKALLQSHQTHTKDKNEEELFKERFFLRELSHQLETLQHSAASGLRGISAMSPLVERDTDRFEIDMPVNDAPNPLAIGGPLGQQVERLAALLTRLEKGDPVLQVPDEEITVQTDSTDAFLIVANKVSGKDARAIAEAARTYVAALHKCDGVRNVGVRIVEAEGDGESDIFVHEIWCEPEDRETWAKEEGKESYDALVKAGSNSSQNTLHVPSTWF